MLNVLLDTSILRRYPTRRTAGMQALERLCAMKELTVHLPSVVRSEYVTGEDAEIRDRLEQIERNARGLLKRVAGSSAGHVEALMSTVQCISESLRQSVEVDIDSWIAALDVKLHEPAASHAERVLRGYFAGRPPFRDLKSRDDFPDAFIFAAVEDVAASHENLHVICADKRLRSACDELANVSTYPDLPAFLALKEVADILRSDDVWRALRAVLKRVAAISTISDRLLEAVQDEDVVDGLGEDGDVIGVVTLPHPPTRLEVSEEEAVDYGGASLWVPFQADLRADVESTMTKSEYNLLDDDLATLRSPAVLNDYVISYEHELELTIYGNFLLHLRNDVEFDEQSFIADPIANVDWFQLDVDSIDGVVLAESDDE